MTNFDFLTKDKQFDTFSNVAIAAEKIIHIDPAACAVNCRRSKKINAYIVPIGSQNQFFELIS